MGDPASPRQRLHLDCQWEILRVEVRGVLSWLREAVRAFIPDFNGDNWRWDCGFPLRDITMSLARRFRDQCLVLEAEGVTLDYRGYFGVPSERIAATRARESLRAYLSERPHTCSGHVTNSIPLNGFER